MLNPIKPFFVMNTILPKFHGDFFSHLNDDSIPAFHKFGGSGLKIDHVISILSASNTAGAVFSVPYNVTKKLFNIKNNLKNLDIVYQELNTIIQGYTTFALPFRVSLFSAWENRVKLFEEVLNESIKNGDLENFKERIKIEQFVLTTFGEDFFVSEVIYPILKKEGLKLELIDSREVIFLKDNFPELSEDLFSFVDINEEKTMKALGYKLSSGEKPVILAGSIAKNGLLGLNGSDITLSLLVNAYYQKTKVIPRVIFWKSTPLYTALGSQSKKVDGVTKYRYFENSQKGATKPFVHPQAIKLLDEPTSIPFSVKIHDDEYHLMVTSCTQQQKYLIKKIEKQ